MSEERTQRILFADPLFRINDERGRALLTVRGAEDGQAGEVEISTPTMRMTIRVPEIARAFDVLKVPADLGPVPVTTGPWSMASIVGERPSC